MTVSNELIDQLLAGYKKPEDLIGENGLLKQLTKRLVERALEAEMTEHLGHTKNASVANAAGNARNGKSKKTLKGDFGELPIDVPVTAMPALSLRSCPSTRLAGRALTTRSCPCTPVA
jgi:putative transposase